ncbi:MAG: DUF420 domain-containing protein [Candidatus Kariarchaeaceae archaeon]|jgi:putative membrane protein
MSAEGIPFLAVTGFVTIALGLIVLLMGYRMAKSKDFTQHRRMMITAVVVLFAFLIQYIVRAVFLGQETRFAGPMPIRNFVYLPILIVHITFAIITIVLIIRHLRQSLKMEQQTDAGQYYFPKEYRDSHRRLGRLTFTLWMFSYLGGIIIFLMLYIIWGQNFNIIF